MMLGSSTSARHSEHRRIRKGTQSCWQCKHRKVRCVFSASHHGICTNCRRRGTVCIGQQYPDNTSIAGDGLDRIGRVESRVRQLAESISISGVVTEKYDHTPSGNEGPATQRPSVSESAIIDNVEDVDHVDPATMSPCDLTARKHGIVTGSSHPAWPSSLALDAILTAPVNITWCLRGLVRIPLCSFSKQDIPSPRSLLEPPAAEAHFPAVAQKLLLLGLYMQSVPPAERESLVQNGLECQNAMRNALRTGKRPVDLRDELIQSMEGIECLALESLYRDNSGDVRPAWLSMRQALSIAQMLSLHRPADCIGERPWGEKTGHVWFRIVQSDRYLSLILGLPQGCSENVFATERALAECSPAERLRRLDCVVTGCIIDHMDKDPHNNTTIRDLDNFLLKASSTMDPRWWLIPQAPTQYDTALERFQETNRIVDQLVHFHVVARLHLPSILYTSAGRQRDYSKVVAVNAAREAIARALLLYEAGTTDVYCRGMHYAVLLFATVICVVHIDSASLEGFEDDFARLRCLLHQRPSDRGMVERTLELLQILGRLHGDLLASSVATIISRLLLVEDRAAAGGKYRISSSARAGLEATSDLSGADECLLVTIPTYGRIKIELEKQSQSAQQFMSLPSESGSLSSFVNTGAPEPFSSQDLNFPVIDNDQSFLCSGEECDQNDFLETLDRVLSDSMNTGSGPAAL